MAQVNVRNAANGGPTKLASDDGSESSGEQISIHNKGTGSVFVGKADVTIANGYELLAGEWVCVAINTAVPLVYAVSSVDGQRVDVLVL